MITKEDAISLAYGTTLYHVSIKGSDNRPARCRVTGKCRTWKKNPEKFKLPVKHGLRHSFYIENYNAGDWRKEEIIEPINDVPVSC